MFAVIGRGLYSKVDEERFGSLFDAIFTTFQLLTLDDWFDIYINASNKGTVLVTKFYSKLTCTVNYKILRAYHF